MEIRRPAKRMGLLIGNDRWAGDFCPGVSLDIANMNKFLQSAAGGAWGVNELIVIRNRINKEVLIRIIKKAVSEGCEYFFIYFGGHGELRRIEDPLFVLPGGNEITLNEFKSLLVGQRVLMISDSCQGFPVYNQGGELNEGQRIFSSCNVTQKFKSRCAFDRAIRNLPPIFTYASAVSPGQSANDTDEGGLYTKKLLAACKNLLTSDDQQGVIGICLPHTMAAEAIRTSTGNEQKPCIRGYTRSNQPPFLVKL